MPRRGWLRSTSHSASWAWRGRWGPERGPPGKIGPKRQMPPTQWTRPIGQVFMGTSSVPSPLLAAGDAQWDPLLWERLVVNKLTYQYMWASQMVLVVKNLPANAGDVRDVGSIPG